MHAKLALFVAVLVVLLAPAAHADRGGNPPPQLLVTQVVADVDAATLLIEGLHFGPDPTVLLGDLGGAFVEQPVVSSTDTTIEAQLTATDPGTYVLVVQAGPDLPFTPRSQLEDDGSCTDLVPDLAPTSGRPASFIKDVSVFVPPFTVM